MKKAIITGVTGQDGSYLAELLLEKGYEVHGLIRRGSSYNTGRIDHIYQDSYAHGARFFLHYGDLSDAGNIRKLIYQAGPDEIYHLGAQSHVRVSFDMPEYTADIVGLGTLRILEGIKDFEADGRGKIKFYQASSSEMFGAAPPPQNENTPFHPRSPYGCAKAMAYYVTINYREAYGIFAANGILFNHESPRRGGTFVSKKITAAFAKIKAGQQDKLYLGNLDARRDWGHAKDYVEAMWLILQAERPDDYVIATGESHSVREFVEETAKLLGFKIRWEGAGTGERGIEEKSGKTIIEIDPRYFRAAEVDELRGDAAKARNVLGWSPKIKFADLVKVMIAAEFKEMGLDPKDYLVS